MSSRNLYNKLMQSFQTTLRIDADRADVYKALTTKEGIMSWWTQDCDVDEKIGGQVVLRFGVMYVVMQIEKLVEDREVVWRCVEQYFRFENVLRANEWLGTVIDFHLEKNDDNTTTIIFTHEGLTQKLASYEQSNVLWTYLLHVGLKGVLEKKK